MDGTRSGRLELNDGRRHLEKSRLKLVYVCWWGCEGDFVVFFAWLGIGGCGCCGWDVLKREKKGKRGGERGGEPVRRQPLLQKRKGNFFCFPLFPRNHSLSTAVTAGNEPY